LNSETVSADFSEKFAKENEKKRKKTKKNKGSTWRSQQKLRKGKKNVLRFS